MMKANTRQRKATAMTKGILEIDAPMAIAICDVEAQQKPQIQAIFYHPIFFILYTHASSSATCTARDEKINNNFQSLFITTSRCALDENMPLF